MDMHAQSADRAPRLVALERGFNLRDFGDYPVSSSQKVRAGVLFRSGTMAYLNELDRATLRGLGLATIVDLRRTDERELEPTDWHDPAAIEYWAENHEAMSGMLRPQDFKDGASADRMIATMINIYRQIPYDHAVSYRRLFERLAEGAVPLLVNCAAGKDRTGIGVAIVLDMLGVPRDLVVADYLLTNKHADFSRLFAFRQKSDRYVQAAHTVTAPLFAADASYLAAMFDELDRRHGGTEGYLTDVLAIDRAALESIRTHLLDPSA